MEQIIWLAWNWTVHHTDKSSRLLSATNRDTESTWLLGKQQLLSLEQNRVGGWSLESVVSFSALSLIKSYRYILWLNITSFHHASALVGQTATWSASDLMCCIYVSLRSLMQSAPFFFTLTCFVCHLRLVFCSTARACGLTSSKMLQPSLLEEEEAILWLQSRSESVRDWRRGIAQEGREGLEDRVARQTRITWAQICLQTECVRPGKTQEPSWRILLVSHTSTHL